MAYRHKCVFAFVSTLFLHLAATQSFNPTILQDSRDLPKVDGTFGFLYRTEDGIAHAAKGDANGVIHGRFSYTDPTGLKVNYNYNAGSRVAPGYDDSSSSDSGQYQQSPQRQTQQSQKQYQPRSQQPQYSDYEERPQPQYVPQSRPSPRPQSRRPSSRLYSAQYREPVENYPQPSRTRPTYATRNDVYEDYSN